MNARNFFDTTREKYLYFDDAVNKASIIDRSASKIYSGGRNHLA